MSVKTRHTPIRSCVTCRQTSAKKTLLRVVRTPGEPPSVAVDLTGKANGRGAYVCASVECIEKAIKQKRFERSLNIGAIPGTLDEELKALLLTASPIGVTES